MLVPPATKPPSPWQRWQELAAYIGDFQARLALTVFYFTIGVPFGLFASVVIDPLRLRNAPRASAWTRRKALDAGLAAARRQF